MQSDFKSRSIGAKLGWSFARRRKGLLVLALGLGLAGDLRALDLSGSLRLMWTDTDFDQSTTTSQEQQFNLELRQQLSPFLLARVLGSYFNISNQIEGGDSFGRRFRQPRLELLYSRPKVTAKLGYDYRIVDSTVEANNFESQGVTGTLLWTILPRLSLNLAFRDDINETDPGAFGRETTTRRGRATLLYQRSFWGASYSYSNVVVENDFSDFATDQDRHDLRLDAARSFLNQRLSLAFSGSAGHSTRDQRVSDTADLAEPIPVAQGLFVIDLTPAIGELEPSPGLIDGNFVDPVSPPIEIGAANTFRNIGVDLGVTRPISRLEISVDRPSGPNLLWELYVSRDNQFWEPLLGATSQWDGDLLHYTLIFAETENRFFKAVNVSVNAADQVQVTEIRALRELPDGSVNDRIEQDLYRVDFSARYRFSTRVNGSIGGGSYNDQTTAADLLLQDNRSDYANAGLNIDLTRELRLTLGYRLDNYTDGRDFGLDRDTREASAGLAWFPLPTVDLSFSAASRDESNNGELLQSTRTSRLAVGLQLLTDLRLITDVSYNRLEDPFSGFDRNSYNASLRFDSRPFRNWFLGGGYNYLLTEAPDRQTLLDRNNVFVQTTWSPGSYLALSGTWRYYVDEFSDSLRQTYGLSYTPGPKLGITATWEDFDTNIGRQTGNSSIGFTYLLFQRCRIFARLSRSTAEQIGIVSENITSAQAGLNIGF